MNGVLVSVELSGYLLGLLLVLAFAVLAVVGFVAIGRAVTEVSDRAFRDRGALEELRCRYVRGEIGREEFDAKRKRLLAGSL
jgi:uncharacterized membrane protein